MYWYIISYLAVCAARNYMAVEELDVEKYIGKWYQVYEDNFDKTFQHAGKCSTADYGIISSNNISVYNRQLTMTNEVDDISGYAYYKEGDTGGYLTVRLDDLPEAPYWVLDLGPIVDGYYDYSIVSDNLKLSLFVLTRDVDRFYEKYDADVLLFLENMGFTRNINKPDTMEQSDCSY